MAKKSMVERERKRKNLVARYRLKRESIIMELKRAHLKGLSFDEIAPLNKILQKLPKNTKLGSNFGVNVVVAISKT
jgi:hypothetical protein